ncbi:hypothetical protein [Sphingopyxis sp. GW247-27LB]|uniref:hypothetical protein n=1 Tax=Sphingopyxis sp. GW247-27LB TaxID=2012632 RepID=UPI000BA621F8|nr:hypothetical protein [Sphingopyxis sp. GW247-27LB]PAL23574.1 hypothetical protein CD928_05770 [Sphingopyxis sp. GW247-27LB]
MTPDSQLKPTQADILRPIIGIESRTAQEVFDIMCDRFRHRLSQSGNAERESGAGKHMSVEMAALFGEISKLTRLRIEHDEALRTGAGISAIEAAANKVDEIIDAIPALMPAFYAADRASASGAAIEQGGAVQRRVIERAVADDLIAAIYKAEGWTPGDKGVFQTRTARCSSVYDITADPRRNRYVATPLAALTTDQSQTERLREAVDGLSIARGIIEADLNDAKEHRDADWIGMSQSALDAIDAALRAQSTGENDR